VRLASRPALHSCGPAFPTIRHRPRLWPKAHHGCRAPRLGRRPAQ